MFYQLEIGRTSGWHGETSTLFATDAIVLRPRVKASQIHRGDITPEFRPLTRPYGPTAHASMRTARARHGSQTGRHPKAGAGGFHLQHDGAAARGGSLRVLPRKSIQGSNCNWPQRMSYITPLHIALPVAIVEWGIVMQLPVVARQRINSNERAGRLAQPQGSLR